MNPYPYKPLDHDRQEIRLLTFSPSRTPTKHRLHASLKHASLAHDSPKYFALSYVWGDPSWRRYVDVDETAISVTSAGERALRAMHNHAATLDLAGEEPVNIWMDAICINQADILEKRQQIPLMTEVYSKASAVLIYLGDDTTNDAEKAIKAIKQLIACCEVRENHLTVDEGIDEVASNFDDSTWEAIASFYSSSWFERIWVVQEVMLSQLAICFRGDESIFWVEIAMAALWLRAGGREYFHQAPDAAIAGTFAAAGLWDAWHRNVPLDLSQMLLMSVMRDATVPDDKVYGILGLILCYADEATKSSISQVADSGLSLDRLYTLVTMIALKEACDTGNVHSLLQIANATFPLAGQVTEWLFIPSWVPRYDWKLNPDLGSPRQIGVGPGLGACSEWSASELDFSTEDGSVFLNILGVVIDEVALVGPSRDDDSDHGYAITIANWWDLTAPAEDRRPTDRDLLVFGDTLRQTFRSFRPEDDDKEFSRSVAFLLRECWAIASGEEEHFFSTGEYEDLVHRIFDKTWNRRFVMTRGGRMAVGRAAVREGDKVCIFAGCKVPFVLRRDGDAWTLVGDVYVSGIMNVRITTNRLDCVLTFVTGCLYRGVVKEWAAGDREADLLDQIVRCTSQASCRGRFYLAQVDSFLRLTLHPIHVFAIRHTCNRL